MISYIKGENFLSYKKLEYTFPAKGFVQITGVAEDTGWASNNGVGKTAILLLIQWVLYGIIKNGIVKNGIINSDVGKDCTGLVQTKSINGQDMIIQRFRKHHQYKNNIHLFVDGEFVNTDDPQAEIVRLIGFDASIFLRAFVFDSTNSIATIKDTEAKNFFEKLLGIDFQSWYVAAKDYKAQEIDPAVTKIQNDLKLQRSCIEYTEKQLEQERNISEEWEKKRQEDRRMHDGFAFTYAQDLALLKEKLVVYKAQEQQLEARIKLSKDHSTFTEHIKQGEIRVVELSRSLNFNSRRKQEYDVKDTCPTCGQKLPPGEIEQAMQRWTENQAELDQEIERIKQLVKAEENALLENKNTLEIIAKQIQELPYSTTPTDDTVENIDRQIQSKQNAIVQMQTKSETLSTAINPHVQRIESFSEEIIGITADIARLEEASKQWEKQTEATNTVIDMFSKTGLPSFMLDRIIPWINNRLVYYLQELTDGEISAKFNMTTKTGKEKFHLQVSKHRGGEGLESLSEGQKARLNLCLVLALHDHLKQLIPTKLLIFDELLDKLDETGVERVVNLLKETAQNTLVLAISHNPFLGMYADDVVTVRMKNYESRIDPPATTIPSNNS